MMSPGVLHWLLVPFLPCPSSGFDIEWLLARRIGKAP